METALLEIKNLNISFNISKNIVNTVDNFSLTLKEKETIGIVGESGSGKTISMLGLTRLLPKQAFVDKGSILFKGRDISAISNKEFYQTISGKKISMIFQEPMTALNPVYTIGRQLMATYLFHNDVSRNSAYNRAIEFLDKVQLTNVKERMAQYPHQLSGGQRQRVMIAMALINSPELLIADEPTTALDVTVQKEIVGLIQKLIENLGMAMIFISHDLGLVSKTCENIIVMEQGLILESGKAEDVLTRPKENYTKNLLKCLWSLDVDHKKIHKDRTLLLDVKNISKSYQLPGSILKPKKIINAVRNISFEIFKGETLAIVGESGSGKSTVAKIINGLTKMDSGDVLLEGKKIDSYSPLERALRIQPVFQDPYSTLNPNHTIGFIVRRPLLLNTSLSCDEIETKVAKTLNLVGLSENFINRFPSQLSGGQRQRVAIARAIILEPKILICDEPTSSLDVTIQSQILDLLNELKERLKITIILISHNISVVKFLSDRVLVMNNGEILESGNTLNIINKPNNNYTKKLMSAIFTVKKKV